MPADTPDMVLVPRELLDKAAHALGATVLGPQLRKALSASPLGASGEGALRPASRSSVPIEGYHNAVLELQEQIDRAEADWNSTVTIQGWAAREIAAALSAPSTTSTAEQVGTEAEGRSEPKSSDYDGIFSPFNACCYRETCRALARPTPATPEGLRGKVTHYGDPCIYCGIGHDDVPAGPCQGKGLFISRERAEALLDFCKRGAGPSGWPTPLWTEVQRFIAEINTALQHQAQGGE